MLTIIVVSEATGETAERVVRAALVRFEGAETTVVRHGNVRTERQVTQVVAEAVGQQAVILHTLVSDDLRRCMVAEARRHGVDAMGLMGPVLDRLAMHLHLTPREMPGLFRQLGEARQREIEAVEFAFRHDDGQRVEDLPRAEVVLVGASRTMRMPSMLYLAYRGWFAANVPLVPVIPVPEPLRSFPASRVFCLLPTPNRLLELRHARANDLDLPGEGYATLAVVRRDRRHTQQLARELGGNMIDATGKSVEAVAQEIVKLLPAPAQEADASLMPARLEARRDGSGYGLAGSPHGPILSAIQIGVTPIVHETGLCGVCGSRAAARPPSFPRSARRARRSILGASSTEGREPGARPETLRSSDRPELESLC